MKYLLIFIACILVQSCNENMKNSIDFIACGCEEPQKELLWLKELIQKAEKDETGNYWGCIWLEKYKGQDIFMTNMMLGSGGVAYWVFDCHGNHFARQGVEECVACEYVGNHHFYIDEKESKDLETFLSSKMKKDIVIYSSPNSNYCK